MVGYPHKVCSTITPVYLAGKSWLQAEGLQLGDLHDYFSSSVACKAPSSTMDASQLLTTRSLHLQGHESCHWQWGLSSEYGEELTDLERACDAGGGGL